MPSADIGNGRRTFRANANQPIVTGGHVRSTTNPPRGRVATITTSNNGQPNMHGRNAVRSPRLSGTINQTSRGSIPVSRQDILFDPHKNAFRYRDPANLNTSIFTRQSSF